MHKSQIATAIALRDLRCYSLDTIDDRILLQKKIFLAQDIGLPLGYGYSWYIHGPYSTDLTAVAYQIIPEGCGALENKRFKEKYVAMIDKVNNLEVEITNNKLELSVVQWYELVASIAYWYRHGCVSERMMIAKIRYTKPQFSEDQIRVGFSVYTRFKTSE